MSATVITLPVVRIEPFGDDRDYAVVLRLDRLTARRLKARSEEWRMSMVETAAAIIAGALDPRRRT